MAAAGETIAPSRESMTDSRVTISWGVIPCNLLPSFDRRDLPRHRASPDAIVTSVGVPTQSPSAAYPSGRAFPWFGPITSPQALVRERDRRADARTSNDPLVEGET
jgi:hypothetical protein